MAACLAGNIPKIKPTALETPNANKKAFSVTCALILIPPPRLSNSASRCDKPTPKTKPIRPPVTVRI